MKKMLSLILAMLMVASAAATSVSASEDLTPVGYWSFDNFENLGNEAEGSTWAAPVIGSSVTATDGISGKALYFDDTSNSYVNLGLVPSTLAGKNTFTVAGWVKVNDNQNYNDVFSIYSGSNEVFKLRVEWSLLQASSYTYEACRTGLNYNVWTHVAATVEMNPGAWNITLYVNGEKAKECTGFGIALGSIPSDAVAYIGAGPNGSNPFTGTIDEMRAFDSVLTAEQIAALRQSDLDGKLPTSADKIENLAGHWTLDSTAVTDKSRSGWGTAEVGSAVTPMLGKIGKALSFDNTSSSYINLGTVPESVAGKSAFTVSGWINLGNNQDYNDIFSIYSGGSEVFKLRAEWNLLQASSYTYEACRTGLNFGEWAHVAATVEMNSGAWNITLYVNGVKTAGNASHGIALGSIPSDAVAYIGAGPNGANPFIGAIDDVKLFTRALKAGEVTLLANDIPQDFEANLAARWTFENGSAVCSDGVSKDDWAEPVIGSSVKTNVPGFSGSGVEFVKKEPLVNTENYIDLGNIPEILSGTTQITMSAWIRPESNNYYMTIFSMVDGSGNLVWSLEDTNSELALKATYEKYSAAGFSGIPEKEWSHVAVSVQLTNGSWSVKTYLNGELKGETNGFGIYDRSALSTNWKLYIGAARFKDGGNSGHTDDFNGKIDDVRLYNTILSSSQINSVYSETAIAPSYAKDSELAMSGLYALGDNSFEIVSESGVSADIAGTFAAADTVDGIFNKNGVYADNIPSGLYISEIAVNDNVITVTLDGETDDNIGSDGDIRFTLLDSATAEGYANTATYDITLRSMFDLWISDCAFGETSISGHIRNARYEGASANLYIATYDADGKLKNIYKTEYQIPSKGDYGAEFKAETGEYDSAKVFMWDGAYAPIVLPKEI